MSGTSLKRGLTLLAAMGLATAAVGCRDHMPHSFTWPGTGDTIYTHPKPPEGGYYSNWDPFAVELKLEPAEDVNPVRTQHVMIATVIGKDGKPLPNRRIEWMISQGSVGDIVEVDESGWRNSRGYKVDNQYAVSHTNNFDHVMDRGDSDPSNDITLTKGQTWIVITSPVEGETYVTAWCPGIYDWNKHKAFAVKKWYDVKYNCPPPVTLCAGQTATLETSVMKYSNNEPLSGYMVTYTASGNCRFSDTGGSTATVTTGADGIARVNVVSDGTAQGSCTVNIEIMRPENAQCCKPAVKIGDCSTSVQWNTPGIDITKECVPQNVSSNSNFEYVITVTNPGSCEATNVVVNDSIPVGVSMVSSSPAGNGTWSLGTLAPGQSSQIRIQATVSGGARGAINNTATVTADGGLSDQASCSINVTQAALAIEKTCTPQVTKCDPISYTVIVRNTGDGPATNVRVVDTLPDGLVGSDGRNSREFNAGNLAPGEAKQATYTATAQRGGTFTNTAVATADGGLTATTSCTTTVSEPSLTISKTASRDNVPMGRTIDFTITASNSGTVAVNDVTITDNIPGGWAYVSNTGGGNATGSSVVWNVGTINPGESKSVGVTLKATSANPTVNKACANGRCATACGEVNISSTAIPAVLLEVVDENDPDEVGTDERYDIYVTNQSDYAPATNIRITCEIQPEASYLSSTSDAGAGANSGQTVTFPAFPSLAPKQKIRFTVVVKGNQEGDTRFKVSMLTAETEARGPIEETESTRFY